MKNVLILSAVLVLSSGGVLAADQPQSGGPRAACQADVAKLCPGVQPGGGRILGCLKQNEAQVSTSCKEAIAKGRARKAPGAPGSSQG
jgi:Cysteine rich repeat